MACVRSLSGQLPSDIAPRAPTIGAYTYYLYLFGGMMFYVAFACNTGSNNDWLSYVPLAGPDMPPGKRADFWAQLITFTEVSGLAVAVEPLSRLFACVRLACR